MLNLSLLSTCPCLCFFLQGRGTVVTGRVEQGIVKVGDDVEIVGLKQVAL